MNVEWRKEGWINVFLKHFPCGLSDIILKPNDTFSVLKLRKGLTFIKWYK